MDRNILEKPFTQDQIKHREGNFGKMLAYVEGHTVIQRLNDAFEARWSFTMQRNEIIKETDEVLVLGQLEADGIVKCQFGSSKITRSRQTKEMISLADDFKSATTDALKKCATMLGVALHLYNGNDSGNGFGNGSGEHSLNKNHGIQPANSGGNNPQNPSNMPPQYNDTAPDTLPQLDGVNYKKQKTQDGKLCILATGNTHAKKEFLKSAGFRWDGEKKVWWRYDNAA